MFVPTVDPVRAPIVGALMHTIVQPVNPDTPLAIAVFAMPMPVIATMVLGLWGRHVEMGLALFVRRVMRVTT